MASTGSFGRHVIAELYGASFHALNAPGAITDALIEGARKAGATVLHSYTHVFEPQGCSVTVVLAESHIAIHTFPELGYASFDAYTCGSQADPQKILDYVVDALGATSICWYTLHRGLDKSLPIDIESFRTKGG